MRKVLPKAQVAAGANASTLPLCSHPGLLGCLPETSKSKSVYISHRPMMLPTVVAHMAKKIIFSQYTQYVHYKHIDICPVSMISCA